ncbi:MAG: ArsA family ATPase [Haloarculaceae archaeon]
MTQYLLFGGKGGVGKTTCAAATGLALAREGADTLVVSTDPAHSLSDSFEQSIGGKPTAIDANLWAVEIDPAERMETYKRLFADLLEEFGEVGVDVEDRDLEELFAAGIAPGGDEVAALDTLLEYAESDRWEYLVLDTAPTGHTLRLLDTPEIVGATVRTAISVRGQVRRLADSAKRMMLGPAYYFGRDDDAAGDELADLEDRMERVAALLRDPERASFTIVLIPERMALAETERLVAELREVDVPVGGLVVNKVLADPAPDCDRCQSRAAAHEAMVAEVRETFPDLPVQVLPERETDVSGLAELDDLADEVQLQAVEAAGTRG